MAYSGGYGGGYANGGPTEYFGALAVSGAGSFTATAGATIVNAAAAFTGAGSFTIASTIVRFGAAASSGAGTFTVRAGVPFLALVSFEATSSFLPIARFTGTDYQLLVVDKYGSVYGEVENARIGSVTFELNGAGGLDFTIPTTDPDASLIQPGREVQLYRGNQLLFWGPIVRHQIGLNEASYQCQGLFWYFERRFMGRADRVNQLVNGDFENSETGWTFNNGVGHSISTSTKVEGTKSLRLTGSTADHTQYASQTFSHSGVTPEGWPGDFMTASVWVYIPSADYVGGAAQDLGLVARHRDSSGNVVFADVAEIGDDTVKDAWIELEVGVPAVKAGEYVDVLLFPPHGTAYFDLVTLTFMESLSFGGLGGFVDTADVVAGIVDYAQQRSPWDLGHGKSDLNIDHVTPATGKMIPTPYAYQFAEHRNIADAIVEFVQAGTFDIDIAVTPTTRTFTTYAPRKGHYRSDLALTLDTTVADFTWSWDGQAAATSVVILGPGDGPDRPEGGASDPTAIGGLTLEWVESAPDDVTVGQLDDRAAERLRVGINPTVIEATTLPGVGYIGQLQTGDTVPVVISYGPLAINATYRAVQITVDPHTDQATVTLNVEV